MKRPPIRNKNLLLENMEPRVLFDAVPYAEALDAPAFSEDHQLHVATSDEALQAEETVTRHVLFVDKSVEGFSQLVEEFLSNQEADVFLINGSSDGLEQIEKHLHSYRDLDSIHIISHGAAGELFLGNATINEESLSGSHASTLIRVGQSLSDNGDILFYGCNLAENESGQKFVETFSSLTGADVAASDDLTGHSSFGGDWNLEFTVGVVEANRVSQQTVSTYLGILAPVSVDIAIAYDGTPNFDADDSPGNDSSPNNGIVRVHDTVAFNMFYNTNSAGATNPILKSLLPEGMKWTAVPPQALGATTGIYDGAAYELDGSLVAGGDGRLLVAHMPDIPGTTSTMITPIATVLGVPNGTLLENISVEFESDEIAGTPLVSSSVDLVASASANANIRLQSTYFRGIYANEDGSQQGAVYQVNINVIGDHPTRMGTDAIKGSAELQDNLAFDLNLDAFGDNARLFNWVADGETHNDFFGGDGATRNFERVNGNLAWYNWSAPAGRPFEHNADMDETHSTVDSGDWTATQSAAGELINVTISGADTTGSNFPEFNARSWVDSPVAAGEKFFVSGQVFVWIPTDEIEAGNDGIQGTSDDGSRSLTLGIENFDPNDAQGLTSNFGAGYEPVSDNSRTFSAVTSGSPGQTSIFREAGTWQVPPTATNFYSGDGVAVVGQTIDHVSHLGTNQGLTDINDVVLAGFFDNSAFKIVESAFPDSYRPDASGGDYDWGYLRITEAGRKTTHLVQGTDYVIEFGTGGQGGDAAFDSWSEMSNATAEDTDTSTIWTSDPTDAALGGNADPDTGIRDSITKYRFRLLRPVTAGAYVYGFVTLEVTGFSTMELAAGNPEGRTLAVFGSHTNANRTTWELSGYDPTDHSGDIYDGDRLTLTDAKVRIDMTVEEAVPGSGNAYLAGTPATFVIEGTVTAPIETGGPAQDVVVENILPAGMFINDPLAATPLAPNGNPVEWYDGANWSVDFPSSGKALGIRWNFGDVPLGTTLETMKFDAIIPFDTPNGTAFANTATISSPSDHSPGHLARTTSAGVVAVQSSSVNGSEITTTPIIGTDSPINFTLQVANVSDTPSDSLDLVAMIPFNGDLIGSNFHGSFTDLAVNNLPAGIEVYVTTADPGDMDSADAFDDGYGDPGAPSDSWYVAPGSGIWTVTLADVGVSINANDVTAIRFVSNGSVDPILPAQSSIEFDVQLTPIGNQGLPASDVYNMQFVARVDSGLLPLPVYSPVASSMVVEAAIDIQTEVMLDPSGTNIDPNVDSHWGESVIATENSIVYYRIQVTNTGTSILNSANVSDFIPAGTTYVAGSAAGDGDVSDFENGWSFGIGPGDTATVVYAVEVTPTMETTYSHTSTVEATDDYGQYVSASDSAGFESNLNPDATDDNYSTDEDTIVSGQLLDGSGGGLDTDPANDVLSTYAVNGNTAAIGIPFAIPSGALVTLNSDGTFDYDPNGAFDSLATGAPASDSFTYRIGDGEGGFDTATVNIAITGQNDAPTIHHGFASEDFTFSGSDKKTTTAKSSYIGDQKFVIDKNATYELSVTAFAGDGAGGEYDTDSYHYLGFAAYDIDDNRISMYHYAKVIGAVDTTLAVDLKPGDTQIVLNDATGWYDGATGHQRTLAWYGYADSTGHVYDDYTYTRNYQNDLWDEGAISGNVITLRDPWMGPAIDAGEAVRNSRSGGSYQYALASRDHIGETPEDLSVVIGGGEVTDGTYSYTLFRPGTHSISALVLADYTNTGTDLTVCNFELREIGTAEANGVVTFTENTGPIDIVDSDASINDVDDLNMESLSITLTNGMIGDTLYVNEAAINALGISVSGIPTTPLTANGTITITLSADNLNTVSKADFVEAMQQVQFDNVTDDPDPNDRVVEFQTNDGEHDSNVDPLLIKIVQLNDSPVVDSTSIVVPEGSQNYSLGLQAPTDVDSADTLTITVIGLPSIGLITLADGTAVTNGMVLTESELEGLLFDGPNEYDGLADPGDFTYEVTDGTTTVSGFVDINILEINDAPQANDDTFIVDEDNSVIIDVLGDDTDPENDSLTVTHVDGQTISVGTTVNVANGKVTLNADGTLTFTPDKDFEGNVDFKYTVSDRVSLPSEAGHSLYVESTSNNGTLIFDMNLKTGEKTFIGNSPFGSSTAMAYDEATGFAYFVRANGDVYAWQNGTDLSTSTKIANIEDVGAGWTDTIPSSFSHQTASFYNGALYVVPTDRTSSDDALFRIELADPTMVLDVVKVADMSGDTYEWNNNDDMIIDQSTGILYGRSDLNDRDNNLRSSYYYTYDLNDGTFTMLAQEIDYFVDFVNRENNPDNRDDFRDINTGMSIGQDGLVYGTDGSGQLLRLNLDGSTTLMGNFPVFDDDGFVGGDLVSSTSHGAISIACVSGVVTAINDAPETVGSIRTQFDVDSIAIAQLDVTSFFTEVDATDVLTFDDGGTLPPGLSIDPNSGIISGTPNHDASQGGPYTVVITADDGNGETAEQVFLWSITNPGPTATDNDLGTSENTSITGNVIGDNDGHNVDTDVDGDSITVLAVDGDTVNVDNPVDGSNGGQFTISSDGSYDFNPGADFDDLAVGESRTTTVTYTITDDEVSKTEVRSQLLETIGSFSHDPTATTHGALGEVTFDFEFVNDGSQALDNLQIIINSTNNATIVNADGGPGHVGSTFTIPNSSLPGGNGLLDIGEKLTVQFVVAIESASWHMDFEVFQCEPAATDTATVSVTVTGTNDDPTTVGTVPTQTDVDSLAITDLDLSAFFDDKDTTDELTFDDNESLPPGLMIDPHTGIISGTLDASASVGGPYTVVITAYDGNGGTATQTFDWEVINPGPTATNDNVRTTENLPVGGNVISDNNGNGADFDVDGDVITISAVDGDNGSVSASVRGSNGGEFVVSQDGSFSFNPSSEFEDLAEGESRATTISYTLTDGEGGFDHAFVEVTVTGTNDAPMALLPIPNQASDDSETISPLDVSSYFVDIDATDELIFDDGGTLPNGLLLDANTGLITGTLAADASTSGPYSVAITATDSQGATVTQIFDWHVSNPAPIVGNTNGVTDEDRSYTIDLFQNTSDPDADAISVTRINGVDVLPEETILLPSGALLTLHADGTATFIPNDVYDGLELGEMAIDAFEFTVDDGQGGITIGDAVITIHGLNDAPVANNETVSTPLDRPITVDVLANDTDVDGQPLAAIIVQQPENGLAVVNSDGTITYTPDEGFFGSQTIDYLVEDPDGGTALATLTVVVDPEFAFDSFTNFGNAQDPSAQTNAQISIAERTVSEEIFTLSPEPIFSGFARPGTKIVGKIFDQAGNQVGESVSIADPGGNWMMQMGTAIHKQYRIEFEQISDGLDVYGFMGLCPAGNTYQSLQPLTQYDSSLSVENAYQSGSMTQLNNAHRENRHALTISSTSL